MKHCAGSGGDLQTTSLALHELSWLTSISFALSTTITTKASGPAQVFENLPVIIARLGTLQQRIKIVHDKSPPLTKTLLPGWWFRWLYGINLRNCQDSHKNLYRKPRISRLRSRRYNPLSFTPNPLPSEPTIQCSFVHSEFHAFGANDTMLFRSLRISRLRSQRYNALSFTPNFTLRSRRYNSLSFTPNFLPSEPMI